MIIMLPFVLLLLLICPAYGGVVKRSVRMVREVYPPEVELDGEGSQPQVCIVGDVVYAFDEPVPAEQPCLKCRCQPPGVQCETVQCAKKSGCKALHRPNRCCPDYQCECTHNGKTYANGEKLETNPGGECKVCYCRGGELQCADVSCYIRKDCEGRRVSGQCCPKYDHCPPIDAVPDNKITIQEIIPERKEIPVTAPPKLHPGTLLIEEAPPTSENDLNIESSEVSEVFQPPPILKIGDKLLILKANASNDVITVIGAEGLQRGGVEEEDLELRPAESTHILSLVKRKSTTPAPKQEPQEQNPAYPPLPDVMPSIEVEVENDTLLSFKAAALPEELLKQKSPIDEEVDMELKETTTTMKQLIAEVRISGDNFITIKPTIEEESRPKNASDKEVVNTSPASVQEQKKDVNLESAYIEKNPAEDTTPSIKESLEDNIRSPIKEDKTPTTETSSVDCGIEPTDANKSSASNATSDSRPSSLEQIEVNKPPSIEAIEVDSTTESKVAPLQIIKEVNKTTSLVSREVEDSGEQTTPHFNTSSEVHDMTRLIKESIELGSVEVGQTHLKDVELINKPPPTKLSLEVSTYELLPTPEEARAKIKREVEDDVFKDLEKELNADESFKVKPAEEEKEEADEVFKELEKEFKGGVDKPKTPEQEKIDSVSNALAGIALKGQIPNANVFKLIGNLFA